MAKSVIIYFSQTGNTKKIAEAIHRGVQGVLGECDISALKSVSPEDLTNFDLIGLGYPTIAAEPPNLRSFVSQMSGLEGKHVFTFNTHGTLPSGPAGIVPPLRQKGLKVLGFKDWYGSVYHPCLPKPYWTDGHPDEIDLKEAEDYGREMAEISQRIYLGEKNLVPTFPNENEWQSFRNPLSVATDLLDARVMSKNQMRINSERCTECNLCATNCPVGAIDVSVSPGTVNTDKCFTCWFCWNICPEGAIKVDFEHYARVHDYWTEKIIVPMIEAAEARGDFRRLVPLEDVELGTHWSDDPTHPRFVIP